MEERTQPQKSKKSVLVIFGVLLTVAVITGLGFKWYSQVQEYKDNINLRDQQIGELQEEVEQIRQGSKDSDQMGTEAATVQYLTIKELGVRIPLSADIRDAFYVVNTDTLFVRFSTETIAKLDATCDPRQGGDAQAGMGRGLPSATDFNMPIKEAYPEGKQLGEYYYYFGHPQSRCAKDVDLEEKITNAFKAAILSAEIM